MTTPPIRIFMGFLIAGLMSCNRFDPEPKVTKSHEPHVLSEILANKESFRDQQIALYAWFVSGADRPWLSREGSNSEVDGGMPIKNVEECSMFAADGTQVDQFEFPATPVVARGILRIGDFEAWVILKDVPYLELQTMVAIEEDELPEALR